MRNIFLPTIFYSLSVCTCCSMMGGCSEKPPPVVVDDEAHASLALESVKDRFGVIDNPEVTDYLHYLSQRLTDGLSKINKSCADCNFTLLNSSQPLAFSPGARHVVISKGLFLRLDSEVELAFVLSHELAHQVLGHQAAINANSATSYDARADLEKDADRFAVGLLAVSGYDPRYAASALLHAYGRSTTSGEAAGYPTLNVRIKLVQDEVEGEQWAPPGTVDRRDFQKIRRALFATAANSPR